ncbi:MAG: hypothetical protein WBQ25_06965 [Nitrososphaeraceae archaeon]
MSQAIGALQSLGLHFTHYDTKVEARLQHSPDRRTFDRRLAEIFDDIKEMIAAIAVLFVKEKFVDPCIVAIDSTMLRTIEHLWHKSSMIEGVVARSGIGTDARWGFSHTELWIFGYKLHT